LISAILSQGSAHSADLAMTLNSAGQAVIAGGTSRAAFLAEGVVKTILLSKLKGVAAVVLAFCMVGTASFVGLVAARKGGEPSSLPTVVEATTEMHKNASPNRDTFTRNEVTATPKLESQARTCTDVSERKLPKRSRAHNPKEKRRDSSIVAQAYQRLVKEYDDLYQKCLKAYNAAKSDEEKTIALQELTEPAQFSGRSLEISKEYPNDSSAIDALAWAAARDVHSGWKLL
jgi:hypothetical protein